MKKGFTLVELLVVIAIIGILSSIGLSTFTTAQIKGRDAKRKSNLDQISRALEMYFNDHKEYPDSDGNGNFTDYPWDSIFKDAKNTVYMVKLPKDPTSGLTYFYDAIPTAGINTKFQLYARLENTKDIAIPKTVTGQPQNYGISCGTLNCNYGVSSTNITPESGRTLTTE